MVEMQVNDWQTSLYFYFYKCKSELKNMRAKPGSKTSEFKISSFCQLTIITWHDCSEPIHLENST